MRITLGATAIALLLACNPKSGGGGASKTPTTDEEKVLYGLGVQVGGSLSTFNLTEDELGLVQAGIADQVLKRELKAPGDQAKVQQLFRDRMAKRSEEEQARSQAYLEKAAQEPGAQKSESGLIYKELSAGTGAQPTPNDRVKVNYKGTLTDGTVFDSSEKNGAPATFPLMGVIPCWTEGLQKVKVGGKAQLVCPAAIAYGERGRPPAIPGGAALTFEVELLEILPDAPPHPGMPTTSPPPPRGDGGAPATQ